VRLQADLELPVTAERVPECHHCGAPLGEQWHEDQEKAKQHGTVPAACPQCGQNPLPPVGGVQQEDQEDEA
jgi:primosomal protein N'